MSLTGIIPLLILLLCVSVIRGDATTQSPDQDFDLGTAHCYDGGQVISVDINKEWPLKHDEKVDSGYCYDNDGIPYPHLSSLLTCCDCISYTCMDITGYEGNERVYKMVWVISNISSSCCQDCKGTVFPPNEEMSVTLESSSCEVQEVATCKNIDGTGSVVKTFYPLSCCFDEEGLHQVGSEHLDPSTCSIRVCSQGSPPFWQDIPVFEGECGCCVYNGTLLREGEKVFVSPVLVATCCKGEILFEDIFDRVLLVQNNFRNLQDKESCNDACQTVPESECIFWTFSAAPTNFRCGIRNYETNFILTGPGQNGQDYGFRNGTQGVDGIPIFLGTYSTNFGGCKSSCHETHGCISWTWRESDGACSFNKYEPQCSIDISQVPQPPPQGSVISGLRDGGPMPPACS